MKRATYGEQRKGVRYNISIHALVKRATYDPKGVIVRIKFQSTPS